MLRRFITFILLKLKIRKGEEPKPAIDILLVLLPYVFVSVAIIGVVKWLGLELKAPWYRKIWYKTKHIIWHWRFALIGW